MNQKDWQTNVSLTGLVRACRQLGLDDDFDPPTAIQQTLNDSHLGPEVYTYLKNSVAPEAKKIVRMYFALETKQREEVTIDHLIAAAEVDHIKVWGAISEEVMRAKGAAASMIAALRSPEAMSAAAIFAGTEGGHADRKMILQTAGVAPVPTNQINRFNIGSMKVDNSKHLHNHAVPSLEEVVREVDALESHVPSSKNS